jgi:beta-phosphoglucomutase-like phosphatase (HAD superfamily)
MTLVRHARPPRQHPCLPVRPRRGPDPDGEGPRGRVEDHVRRVPATARTVHRPPVRALRRRARLRRLRRRAPALRGRAGVPALTRHQAACGTPDDPPSAETVDGLGNRKNELVLQLIHERGVERYSGPVRYVEVARGAGLRRAVVSSSANTREVLRTPGIEQLFEEVIDGVVADREHLRGKPAPDTFLAAARAMGVEPPAAAVFEDSLAPRGRPRWRLRLCRWGRPHGPGRRAPRARRDDRRRRPRRADGRHMIGPQRGRSSVPGQSPARRA